MTSADDCAARFKSLQTNLAQVWEALQEDKSYPCTSVIVPSMSVDQEELAKVTGAGFYEERLMFALIRLRNANARLIYVTSQPVHPDVVDYYLQLLDSVSASHARNRLTMIALFDSTARPLSQKILERPHLIRRLRDAIGDRSSAYLTVYNSTVLERDLAMALGIPLNGLDPALLDLGTKSGNRKIFAEAGVAHPAGFEDLSSEREIIDALLALRKKRPRLSRAVIKLDEGFGGEGNAVFQYPDRAVDEASVRAALSQMAWLSGQQTYEIFMRKFTKMGGIVEEMIEGTDVRSPSVQMRILPDRKARIVSTHEQVLGGATGQAYMGCRFPAEADYRGLLQQSARKVADVLCEKGVIGRFAIDFLVSRNADEWQAHAIEINLRMGGTTPPFHALEFLTDGSLDEASGLFRTPSGQEKYYKATDNLKSPAYRGLLPEDLFDIVLRHDIGFRHATGKGVLFYMIGALSQYGKLGVTCIGDSPDEAQALFERTVQILDDNTRGDQPGRALPMNDRYIEIE